VRNTIAISVVTLCCGILMPAAAAGQEAFIGEDSLRDGARRIPAQSSRRGRLAWPDMCTSAVTRPTASGDPCAAPSPFDPASAGLLTLVNRSREFQAGDSTVVRNRSTRRKVIGAVVGATGGFFAGGYTGA